ncbi:hypothetical protein ACG1VR_12770 [Cedecea davisae]|uniref:Uncharacterized protein n=1 Tax=Cedecea lapagei TaxID=158823 RepID=A0A3S5DPQ1_9ENTR|nr:hypothetical protein [Cedecea lapagei]VEB96846.1 Uncharacterised protein [Cedecea lapagei]VEB97393.1 Uncharacterised protein [Cedecea lapagei]
MLSQLTLCIYKKLIEVLKIRTRHESTSVNALVELDALNSLRGLYGYGAL